MQNVRTLCLKFLYGLILNERDIRTDFLTNKANIKNFYKS